MAASAGLVAELAEDRALRSALDRLPGRLHRALALDWSEIADDLSKASAVFVAARGLGLGSAREIALKLSEILRLPSIGLSAAELQHGPRAALSSRTPVVMMRLMDETAATRGRTGRRIARAKDRAASMRRTAWLAALVG